ncbi:MAG TPA: hypothetical protein VLC79_10455 [Cellvibrio sp.]|nr:hypothetical protein [Cellvibrio sp.]
MSDFIAMDGLPVLKFATPLFEIAPYATFCILLLIAITIAYLRIAILGYCEKNLPDCFTAFRLYEEHHEPATSLALYQYLISNSFEQSKDTVFIALCRRYIRWGHFFIIFFIVATIDINLARLAS